LPRIAAAQHSVCADLETPVHEWAHYRKPRFAYWDGFVLRGMLGIAGVEQLVADILVFAARVQAGGQFVESRESVKDRSWRFGRDHARRAAERCKSCVCFREDRRY